MQSAPCPQKGSVARRAASRHAKDRSQCRQRVSGARTGAGGRGLSETWAGLGLLQTLDGNRACHSFLETSRPTLPATGGECRSQVPGTRHGEHSPDPAAAVCLGSEQLPAHSCQGQLAPAAVLLPKQPPLWTERVCAPKAPDTAGAAGRYVSSHWEGERRGHGRTRCGERAGFTCEGDSLHPSLGRASTRVSLRAPRGASRLPGVEGRERLG